MNINKTKLQVKYEILSKNKNSTTRSRHHKLETDQREFFLKNRRQIRQTAFDSDSDSLTWV